MQSTLTPAEAFALAYGESRNLLTPNRLSLGGDDLHAYEVSTGDGILEGTQIVGVTVVQIHGERVEHDYSRSRSFHGTDVNALVDEALDYVRTLPELVSHARKLEVAERLGREAGQAAGSWVIDGNTPDETCAALLAGIEDGDPAVLGSLPSAPLSGEWADGWTPNDVIRDVEAEVEVEVSEEERDDLLTEFERGFALGVEFEVVQSAKARVA